MLFPSKRPWHYFDTGVLATHAREAQFLKQWYLKIVSQGKAALYFEVLDLHLYKKLTKPNKVQARLSANETRSFVFLIGKN